ncbi:MAG: hypothetical protein JSS93_04180 [Bacteroidetes bacterium]|nr:hypothetical protein [Bacteroidota bacterium]
MRKPLKSRELAYLETYGSKELDVETLQAIKEKRVILEDEPLYVRSKITGGGEIDLLTSSLNESVGITNIDKRTLPKFVNFIINALQFGYGSAPTGNGAVAEDIVYDSLIANCPVQLQHANLIVKQNDTPILTQPIKQLLHQDKSREFEGDVAYNVTYPRLIKQNVPFQISIKFPIGKALPAGVVDHFVEVHLKGTRTRLRGAK